jgi:hypothetical protein
MVVEHTRENIVVFWNSVKSVMQQSDLFWISEEHWRISDDLLHRLYGTRAE